MAREAIIYVHGLWSSRADSVLLRRRLARTLGCEVWMFRYPSMSSPMAEVIERLRQFVAECRGAGSARRAGGGGHAGALADGPPDTLHWVGHSLGGLVIYRFLERFPNQPSGRVVFLGTPAVACRAAVGLARLRWMTPLAGKCVNEELLVERERRWTGPRELGIIAGTRGLGFGHLVARLDGENDGTIAVRETRLPGATDFITVPASHMGLLLSAQAARETAAFLREGHFSLSPRVSVPPFSNARSS